MALDLARGMSYLHRRCVLHRDLKAENCMLREDQSVVIVDFGLARLMEGESMTKTRTHDDNQLTKSRRRLSATVINASSPDMFVREEVRNSSLVFPSFFPTCPFSPSDTTQHVDPKAVPPDVHRGQPILDGPGDDDGQLRLSRRCLFLWFASCEPDILI